MTDYFKQSLKNGKYGELIVKEVLKHEAWAKNVIDVSGDEYFRSVDVDFLVEDITGQYRWFEVKTDYQAHQTRNIAVECKTSGNEGWFTKSKAKFLAYYIPEEGENGVIYLIGLDALRNYVEQTKHHLKYVRMGDYSEGYLIPIEHLIMNDVVMPNGIYNCNIVD